MGSTHVKAVGIDVGKVGFKAVLLRETADGYAIGERFFTPHHQEIDRVWRQLREKWALDESVPIVSTGRFRDCLPHPSVVEKVAQETAARFLYPNREITVIRLGGGGFSVLNLRQSGLSDYRWNPRCAAGVGTFLDQIMGRVNCTVVEADRLAGDAQGVEITKRCGVTMKTDFTHLLNTGHPLPEVVAGLLDASAKSVLELADKCGFLPLVLAVGGLSGLQRVQKKIAAYLPPGVAFEVPECALYVEALGAALVGARAQSGKACRTHHPATGDRDAQTKGGGIALSETRNVGRNPVRHAQEGLAFLPPLGDALSRVRKFAAGSVERPDATGYLVAGLDIGSTGSKLVVGDGRIRFEHYTETLGRPVEAAQNLVRAIPEELLQAIKAIGITGSGREVVSGALKASLSQGDRQRVFVLNEIAAHAAGAQYYDRQVDTVVDIGGQDAKYTRLESGRVIDSCMNTVCSAGTGSFLQEQMKSLGIDDVAAFGEMALQAPRAVDLGQHCAVFIAEQIDEAQRRGAQLPEIVAGLYYSIILNYDNRVKGAREYGERIFLQGKPATNLALAAALAAVSGKEIAVPPSPGTPGALGIAVLCRKELGDEPGCAPPLALADFIASRVSGRKSFRCQAKDGCEDGNRCPIQQIKITVQGRESSFFWGGACDKFEKKTGANAKLACAPDPFAERETFIRDCLGPADSAAPTVGIPRGLEGEEILPFSITFFRELGFAVRLVGRPGKSPLEEGAKLCASSFCAPLQLLGGLAKLQDDGDFIFLPKILEVSGNGEANGTGRSYACPLSQAAPDMFAPKLNTRVISPALNLKFGLETTLNDFLALKKILGRSPRQIRSAFDTALAKQRQFAEECVDAGRRALAFARENNLPTVVLLGHPYIVNSPQIAAGIPEAVRQSGAVVLPATAYPVAEKSDAFESIFWGYGRHLLQVAEEVRRTDQVYPLWLSVYSCGPDSFLIHFFQYLSQGKPYAILESDAHTGLAGFKTRIEAFLYGIQNYQRPADDVPPDFAPLNRTVTVDDAIEDGGEMLIPWMGESSLALAATLRSLGIAATALPLDTGRNLELGRKHTSGKECLPLIITLGGLLNHLRENPGRFYYLMPRADGPCRFGNYHLLMKIALQKAGVANRVEIISPTSVAGYGEHVGDAAMAKAWAAVVLSDMLRDALHDVRPEETEPGAAEKCFAFYLKEMDATLAATGNGWQGMRDLWGLADLARRAANAFKTIPRDPRRLNKPVVLVAGEIFLRLNRFSNNGLVEAIERFDVKVRLAPFREWMNYVGWLRKNDHLPTTANRLKTHLVSALQRHIEKRLHRRFADSLGWPADHPVEDILRQAEPHLTGLKPLGEAALTIGLPLLLWRLKQIAATIVVGPFECMPSRIAETQLQHAASACKLPVLSLSYHGEPPDADILEGFLASIGGGRLGSMPLR